MKWLIGLLTAATGILHILVGFNIVGGFGVTNARRHHTLDLAGLHADYADWLLRHRRVRLL